jgi:hypothetical protein
LAELELPASLVVPPGLAVVPPVTAPAVPLADELDSELPPERPALALEPALPDELLSLPALPELPATPLLLELLLALVVLLVCPPLPAAAVVVEDWLLLDAPPAAEDVAEVDLPPLEVATVPVPPVLSLEHDAPRTAMVASVPNKCLVFMGAP